MQACTTAHLSSLTRAIGCGLKCHMPTGSYASREARVRAVAVLSLVRFPFSLFGGGGGPLDWFAREGIARFGGMVRLICSQAGIDSYRAFRGKSMGQKIFRFASPVMINFDYYLRLPYSTTTTPWLRLGIHDAKLLLLGVLSTYFSSILLPMRESPACVAWRWYPGLGCNRWVRLLTGDAQSNKASSKTGDDSAWVQLYDADFGGQLFVIRL